MISAVYPQGGLLRFMLYQGSDTAKVFRELLKRLMVGATKLVFLIVDAHPIHRANLVKNMLSHLMGSQALFSCSVFTAAQP